MEIVNRNTEDVIYKSLVDEIVDQINKSIIERIRSNFPYFYFNPENRKKYEDKFEVRVVGDNIIPYKVQHFIHEQIEKEINQGYIERNPDDEDNQKKWSYKIPLEEIHKVIYIYDHMFNNKVVRYHQTENEYQKTQKPMQLTPININWDKPGYYASKYCIKIGDF